MRFFGWTIRRRLTIPNPRPMTEAERQEEEENQKAWEKQEEERQSKNSKIMMEALTQKLNPILDEKREAERVRNVVLLTSGLLKMRAMCGLGMEGMFKAVDDAEAILERIEKGPAEEAGPAKDEKWIEL